MAHCVLHQATVYNVCSEESFSLKTSIIINKGPRREHQPLRPGLLTNQLKLIDATHSAGVLSF